MVHGFLRFKRNTSGYLNAESKFICVPFTHSCACYHAVVPDVVFWLSPMSTVPVKRFFASFFRTETFINRSDESYILYRCLNIPISYVGIVDRDFRMAYVNRCRVCTHMNRNEVLVHLRLPDRSAIDSELDARKTF
jgi:hypothetical protein